jgi:hypothetical protein
MHTLQDQQRIDLRLRLRYELRQLIKQIEIFPEGNPRQTQEWADWQLQSTIDLQASETIIEKHRKSLAEMVENRKDYLARKIHNSA